MRTDEEHILIVRIKRQCPDPLARQTLVFRVDACPRLTRVRAAINSAANCSNLIRIADEDLIAVARIDQNAGEIAERKITAANLPGGAPIVRHVERLLCANVDVVRSLRILGYRVHRYVVRYAVDLPPRLAAIARNKNSRTRRAHPDRLRMLRSRRDAGGPWVERTVREFLPTFGRIDTAIETSVSSCQDRGLLGIDVDRMDQGIDRIRDDQVSLIGGSWTIVLSNSKRGQRNRIELASDRQVTIALKLLQRGSCSW